MKRKPQLIEVMVSLNGTTKTFTAVADGSARQLVKKVGVVTLENGWDRTGRPLLDRKWSHCIYISCRPATKRDLRRHGYRPAK